MNALVRDIPAHSLADYYGWHTHVPHVGPHNNRFSYDLVVVVRHKPFSKTIGNILENYARNGDVDKDKLFKILNAFKAVADLTARCGHATFGVDNDSMIGKRVMKHFGHVAVILRREGIAQKLYGNAHIAGIYPSHLAYDRVAGEKVYYDPDITDADRNRRKQLWREVYPAHLSNDDDMEITSCAIFKLDPSQYHDFPHALYETIANRGYQSFAEGTFKGNPAFNCVRIVPATTKRIGLTLPQEFLHSVMPPDVENAIEKLATTSSASYVTMKDMAHINQQRLARIFPAQRRAFFGLAQHAAA